MDRQVIPKLKKISSRIFTLSYPKYRFFVFTGILILLRILPFSFIEKTHGFSLCSAILGKYCFSVGITRGVSSLLRGDFSNALEYNLLSIPVLAILIIFILHDFYKAFIK
jgi:hypothetical protein